jgi:type IV pilus assembly protein PilB
LSEETPKQKIGQLLKELKVVDDQQLSLALEEQKRTKERLGSLLIKMGFLTPEDLDYLLARQYNVAFISLEQYRIDPNVVHLIPEKYCREHKVVAVQRNNKLLTVAMASPHDIIVVNELSFITGLKIAPVVSAEISIQKAIDTYYPKHEETESKELDWETELAAEEEVEIEIVGRDEDGTSDIEDIISSAEEGPIVRLVNLILVGAMDKQASHIHIEPFIESLRVRLRIDGVLTPLISPPRKYHINIINRLKILSSLDITKHHIPQENYLQVRSKGRFVDIKVSTFPTRYGESAVLSLHKQYRDAMDLDSLGMAPEILKEYKALVGLKRGFVLVVGPNNSGKTSNLYAVLNHLNTEERSIYTFENPIKNLIEGIFQGQPNEKVGFSYTDGVRSTLAQDPDVVMLGDMNYAKAIEYALQASLSRTLLLGRLNYNDSAGAILHLMDMGIPPFLISQAITAVLSQRLVRKICPACSEDFIPPQKILEEIAPFVDASEIIFYRGRGCRDCGLTGYFGHVGIFELTVLNEEIRQLILDRASRREIRDAIFKKGTVSLYQDALQKVIHGETTYEEILNIADLEMIQKV